MPSWPSWHSFRQFSRLNNALTEGGGEVDVAVVVVEGAADGDVEGGEVAEIARLAVDPLEAGVVLVDGEVAEDHPAIAASY